MGIYSLEVPLYSETNLTSDRKGVFINTYQFPELQKPNTLIRYLGNIWRWLTEPATSIRDIGLRRRARLISSLLLIISLAVLLGYLIGVNLSLIIPIVVVAYGLSRTKYYILAVALTIGALSIPPFIRIFALVTYNADNIAACFMWLILPLVLSSFLFSLRGTAIVAASNFVAILLLPLFISDLSFPLIFGPLGFIGTLFGLILITIRQRDLLEKDRQAELRQYRDQLEKLVEERTAELVTTNEQLQREFAERKQAEERLRLHAAALKVAGNGVFITDYNGVIIWTNPAFSSITGYAQGEAINQTPRILKSGKHDQAFFDDLWERIRSGKIWYGEITNRRKDGSLYTEIQTITPVYNDRGEISHYVAIIQDITERVYAEAELQKYHQHLEEMYGKLTQAYDETLAGWARALELRDRETEGHSQRVADLTIHLAQVMGIAEDDLIHVRRGALLHDIGKMGVPDKILLKAGPLTNGELRIIRQHPTYAYQMLSPITYLAPALDIPYYHHERWDGTGYPQGLKGEQIPLAARIFAVVDVWDALSSNRIYRAAWSENEALAYIQKQAGTHFDPQVVEQFVKIIEKEQHRFRG